MKRMIPYTASNEYLVAGARRLLPCPRRIGLYRRITAAEILNFDYKIPPLSLFL